MVRGDVSLPAALATFHPVAVVLLYLKGPAPAQLAGIPVPAGAETVGMLLVLVMLDGVGVVDGVGVGVESGTRCSLTI